MLYNVDNKLIPYIISDERKRKYLKYSKCVFFFSLNIEEMQRAIKLGSAPALISLHKHEKKNYFRDYYYIYEYEILNKKGDFGIVAVNLIESEKKIDERIRKRKNRK